MRTTKNGFTLVEMLTVVAVIGIIASLMLIGISKSITKAKSIQCRSNVRQFLIAFEMFSGQTGQFPLLGNPNGLVPGHEISWSKSIERSGGLPDMETPSSVWQCPSAKRPVDYPKNESYIHYGYNALGSGTIVQPMGAGGFRHDPNAQIQPVAVSSIKAPALFILIGDGFQGDELLLSDGSSYLWRTTVKPEKVATERVVRRHEGMVSVGLADGHVENTSLADLFSIPVNTARLKWDRTKE